MEIKKSKIRNVDSRYSTAQAAVNKVTSAKHEKAFRNTLIALKKD